MSSVYDNLYASYTVRNSEMEVKSVLLALDGSAQSKFAGDLCKQLCLELEAKLTACHVVDTPGIWEFLGHKSPGYIGSGPYMEIREQLKNSLLSLGEKLAAAYESHTSTRTFESECFVVEGNPVSKICELAFDYDLIVIGHRATGLTSPKQERRRFPRTSIAEQLACYCPKPLLVIQDQCALWSNIRPMILSKHLSSGFLEWCTQLSKNLSIPVQAKCWTLKNERTEVLKTSEEIKAANSNLRTLDFSFIEIDSNNSWCTIDIDNSELPVLPTLDENGLRKTVFGAKPEKTLRYCALPSILFYPQGNLFQESTQPLSNISNTNR